MGAASCVLLTRAGERFLGRRAGVVAGLLLATYPPALYFTGLLQKATLDVLLLAALLAVTGRLADRPAGRLALGAGALLGLLALVRENALVLVPVVAAWLLWRGATEAGARRRNAALLVAGTLLVLMPVAVRNRAVGGGFHLTTFQLGTNLYIGNNPRANGIYVPLVEGRGSWRHEREDAVRLAERAQGRTLSPTEVSRYWTGQALAYAWGQPGAWLALMARKWLLVWNHVELGDTDSQALFEDDSWLLRGLGAVWNFAVLAPLAAFGVVLTWRLRGRLALLYAIVVAFAGATALFYVFARYRFGLVPVLALFAAGGLVEGVERIRERRWPALAAGALAAALAAAAVRVPLVDARQVLAESRFNVAWELERRGESKGAARWYQSALAAFPRYAGALNNLGNLEARQGRLDEAERLFAQAVQVDSSHANSRLNLGKVRAARGDRAQAAQHYREALRLRPDWPEAHRLLGSTLLEHGDAAAAVASYQALVRLFPDSAPDRTNLGSVLARAGRTDEAIAEYQEALRRTPGHLEALTNLAYTHLRRGDLEQARLFYQEALRVDPESAGAREALLWIDRQRPGR
jgi:tetratricopeptide (TPR) repeat protein